MRHPKLSWLSLEEMPSCQCSAGHLSVLWCRQFIDELAKVIDAIGAHCGKLGFNAEAIDMLLYKKV